MIYLNAVTATKPTVMAVNFSSPWVIEEIDNANLHSVIATFGTTADALLDVVTGSFNPVGRMPFSTPVTQEAAENNRSDVPGYLEPEGYALFKFGDGLRY